LAAQWQKLGVRFDVQEADALCVKVKAERDYFKEKCGELKLQASEWAACGHAPRIFSSIGVL
jgi:hypothetical protein